MIRPGKFDESGVNVEEMEIIRRKEVRKCIV